MLTSKVLSLQDSDLATMADEIISTHELKEEVKEKKRKGMAKKLKAANSLH